MCPPPRRLVRPVRRDPAGEQGPTRGESVGPRWRRTSQGFYVPSDVDGALPEQRIMEQSVRLPEGGAVTGWGSLRLWGGGFFDGFSRDGISLLPVPLAVGADHSPRQDGQVCLSRERLDPDEVVVRHGVPCTREPRALFDEMRRMNDLREAVVAMDMAAAARIASVAQMRSYLQERTTWRRSRLVAKALTLASEQSRSPNETRMRLLWQLDAGLPPPLVNQPVWDPSGRLLGIADLLDPVAGVVGGFDGADHRWARRHSRDVAREDGFRRHGLEYFKVTGIDLADPALVVDRMRSTRARASWDPESRRRWTIDPPAGWPREQTLDEYLEHRAWTIACYRAAGLAGS